MKDLSGAFRKIYKEHRKLFLLMVFLMLLSVILLVFSLVNLQPGATVVKVGYGDIGRYEGVASSGRTGGYYDGSWLLMFSYPLLALLFGGLHNLLAVKLFQKKGASVAAMFVTLSILLVIATFIVLVRLLGES